jgi:YVTN family beta-propeller protein
MDNNLAIPSITARRFQPTTLDRPDVLQINRELHEAMCYNSPMLRRCFCAALLGLLFICTLASARADSNENPSFRLYVGNSTGNDVSVIDLSSLKLIDTLTVGPHVHCIALTPDGRRLFTTTELDNTLVISDVTTGKILSTVKMPGRPNECAVTPDARYVTVPIRDGNSVVIVDANQGKIAKILPIKDPHNSVNIGSNRYSFVSSMGSNEIDVIDLEKLDFSAHIPTGGRPRPFVVSKNGRTLYVAISDLHGFNIVDIPTQKLLQRVALPSEHPGPPRPRKYETPDTYTHGLALTPDESEIWVTSLLDDCIYIYDLKAKKVVARLNTGDGPNWVVFSPDGKYGCVSSTDSDDVSIFDVKQRREAARIKVGKVPKRLAIGIAPPSASGKQLAKQ